MKIREWGVIGLVVIAAGAWWIMNGQRAKKDSGEEVRVVSPEIGDIAVIVSAMGKVQPKNRLQVKPPVNGRIDEVLVREGQRVAAGDILAWMSSTDRAALLDAARGRGEDAVRQWQDVYKAIPLLSPISGEVIVGTIQPGQTVTTADDVVVLSDRLIVRGGVDETDIGRIAVGQAAVITLDAYPDSRVNAVVDHIYYESKTVNNVTIYDVDLIPETVPEFFRSGMNTNIDFVIEQRSGVLLLPLNVVDMSKGGPKVTLEDSRGQRTTKAIVTGLSDDRNVEVVSGLSGGEKIVATFQRYSLPRSAAGTNPFLPSHRR